ncbi:unnamed protein product, partial [Closterium sp. NIES-65]
SGGSPTSIYTHLGGQRETKGSFTAEPVKLFVYEANQGLSRCGLQLAFHANFTFSLSPRSGRVGFNGLAFVISATDQVGSGAGVGKAFTAWVDYEPGDPGTIQVFLADSQEKPQQAVLEWRLALCEVLQAYGLQLSTNTYMPARASPFPRYVSADYRVAPSKQDSWFISDFHSWTPCPSSAGLSRTKKTAVSETDGNLWKHVGANRWAGACWAFALVASVEAAYGIALNAEAPQLSVESLFAAMGLTSEADKCSTGGSPTEALERLLMLPRGGVTETFKYKNPGCYTGRLDHVVLVIGYFILRNDGSQNRIAPPFWIIRNSWGVEWGDRGHMRMDIQGGDGVCGINVLPGIYPIVKIRHRVFGAG